MEVRQTRERQRGREAERGDLCHSFAVRRTSCGPFNFQCRGSGALLAGQCARTLKDEGKAEDEEASERAGESDGRKDGRRGRCKCENAVNLSRTTNRTVASYRSLQHPQMTGQNASLSPSPPSGDLHFTRTGQGRTRWARRGPGTQFPARREGPGPAGPSLPETWARSRCVQTPLVLVLSFVRSPHLHSWHSLFELNGL